MSATRCRPKLQGVQLPYSIQIHSVVFINYRYVFVIRDAFAREVLGVAELGQNLPNASWSIVAATDRDVCTICKY